jgi:hypothetical protein
MACDTLCLLAHSRASAGRGRLAWHASCFFQYLRPIRPRRGAPSGSGWQVRIRGAVSPACRTFRGSRLAAEVQLRALDSGSRESQSIVDSAGVRTAPTPHPGPRVVWSEHSAARRGAAMGSQLTYCTGGRAIVMHETTSTLEKVSDTNLTLVDLPTSHVRPRPISKTGKPSAMGSLRSPSSLPPVGHKVDLHQAKSSPPERLTLMLSHVAVDRLVMVLPSRCSGH